MSFAHGAGRCHPKAGPRSPTSLISGNLTTIAFSSKQVASGDIGNGDGVPCRALWELDPEPVGSIGGLAPEVAARVFEHPATRKQYQTMASMHPSHLLATRQARLVTWPLVELLDELAGEPASLPQLRADLRRALQSRSNAPLG